MSEFAPTDSIVSSELLETQTNNKIRQLQLMLNDIRVYDTLCSFNNLGQFTRSFLSELEWLRYTWLDETSDELFDAKRVCYIEDRIVELPFEAALRHNKPEFFNLSLHEIRDIVFPVEWRHNPSLVMNMSREDKERIYKQFEYMCYYVLNTREALLFDIQSALGCEAV